MSKRDFKAGIDAMGRVIQEYNKMAEERRAMSSNDKMKIIEDIIRSYCQKIQIDWEDIPEATKEKLVAVWYENAIIKEASNE